MAIGLLTAGCSAALLPDQPRSPLARSLLISSCCPPLLRFGSPLIIQQKSQGRQGTTETMHAYPMGGHVSARVIPASCCCLIVPIASSTEVLLIALLETKSCHRDPVLQMSAMPPSTPSLIQQLYSPHQSSRVEPGRTLLILLLLIWPLLLQ